MVNETEKKAIEYPNIVERFREVFQKLGIKKGDAYVDHCAKGDLESLDDVEEKLFEMGLHPSLRNQVVNFWAAEIKQPVPKTLKQKMEKEARIQKRGTGEEEADRIYFVDSDTGIIRQAVGNEKATTLTEAKELQKIIKKDLEEQRKRSAEEGEGKEPAFIIGEDGTWTLNPKGKIGFGEFAVFQMYQDSLKKGEPIDPIEELARREESSARLREAMGVKGKPEDTELSTLEKLQKLGLLKEGKEGGTVELITVLSEAGLLRKSGEEGVGLKTELGELRKKLEEMAEEKSREQFAGQQRQIENLTSVITKVVDKLDQVEKGRTGRTEMDILHEIATEGIGVVRTELPGMRKDIKEALGSGALPPPKSPAEKEERKRKYSEALQNDREIEELGRRLFFSES